MRFKTVIEDKIENMGQQQLVLPGDIGAGTTFNKERRLSF
jgi:hypothetical protein